MQLIKVRSENQGKTGSKFFLEVLGKPDNNPDDLQYRIKLIPRDVLAIFLVERVGVFNSLLINQLTGFRQQGKPTILCPSDLKGEFLNDKRPSNNNAGNWINWDVLYDDPSQA